jgi:hypothetical protein
VGAEFRTDRPELIGLKAGAMVSWGWALGLQYIHYTERPDSEEHPGGSNSMEVVRPEIGFDIEKFRVTYAYNIALTKPRIDGVNTHMLSLAYAWRVARLPGDDDHRSHRAQ